MTSLKLRFDSACGLALSEIVLLGGSNKVGRYLELRFSCGHPAAGGSHGELETVLYSYGL